MVKLYKKTKLVFGAGVNDADYCVQPTVDGKRGCCPFYRAWHNMLNRCFSDKFQQQNPTYIGCSVCEEWLVFSNFRSWMINKHWQGKQLDKDFLGNGKLYSPETCLFVPQWLNSLFLDCGSSRGNLPQGVNKYKNRYAMQININGKGIIKTYHTIDEAAAAYIKAKEAHVRSKYNVLDEALIQGCEVQLSFIRFPLLKALCR